jgi:p-hydroxybenzoate 3-monooxygenase
VKTQVAIVGAGPAGLVLSHLLHHEGIDSLVLEDRSREYLERRVRAGVLEQSTCDLLSEIGVGDRLRREGLVHHGILIGFDRQRHRIALSDLTQGRSITIYGQQEIVKDLIAARLSAGGVIEFGVEDVRLRDVDSPKPSVRYRKDGQGHDVACDFIAGCDGAHGVTRSFIPQGILTLYERDFPFAWLGILAAVAPSTEEVLYTRHERGFALHSLRSPTISRLYLQVERGADLAQWSDDRIWSELRLRLSTDDRWTLQDGPVLEKSVAVHRSVVVEPLQYGRLFLAGDAAHIVPPTGAKGLNLAVADVRVLAGAITRFYRTGDAALLEQYSARCLRRIWRVQAFSSFMTLLLHRLPDADAFQERLLRADLDWICRSEAAARSLAQNYVGLPFDEL